MRRRQLSMLLLTPLLAIGLGACSAQTSGTQPSSAATAPVSGSPSPTTASPTPPFPAVTPIGPVNADTPLPKLELAQADVVMPERVGELPRLLTEGGFAIYQTTGDSLATISTLPLSIEQFLPKLTDPLNYGRFICGHKTLDGPGIACVVGLSDGRLEFADDDGADATLEGSAAFAAAALQQMGL